MLEDDGEPVGDAQVQETECMIVLGQLERLPFAECR